MSPTGGGSIFAAYRNLKRDHIDEERDWIWRHKCADDVAKCPELLQQWATYEAEQASPRWPAETVAIEGSLLLQQFDVDEESDKSVAEQVPSPIRHTKLSAPAKGSPHRPPHVAASRRPDQGLRARDRPLPRMG